MECCTKLPNFTSHVFCIMQRRNRAYIRKHPHDGPADLNLLPALPDCVQVLPRGPDGVGRGCQEGGDGAPQHVVLPPEGPPVVVLQALLLDLLLLLDQELRVWVVDLAAIHPSARGTLRWVKRATDVEIFVTCKFAETGKSEARLNRSCRGSVASIRCEPLLS
jgi:hypothetical protein